MAFRVACFVAMIWVPSPYRWVLLGAAVLLPYIAVIFANQADQRRGRPSFDHGEPTGRPELTAQNRSIAASGGSPASTQPGNHGSGGAAHGFTSTSSTTAGTQDPGDPSDDSENLAGPRTTRGQRG